MDDGIARPLSGGNLSRIVRVGDTVHRSTGRWTEAVHALLRHLEACDLPGVPRVLGYDEHGREVLTYLPGVVPNEKPWPVYVWSEQTLHEVGEWLRRYHDAVRAFRPSESSRWWYRDGTTNEGEIICHNDLAPYNALFVDEHLEGVIDWDIAGPARPLWDLAFCAWSWVPLHHPDLTRSLGGPGEEAQTSRLVALCRAYGNDDVAGLLRIVIERVVASRDGIRSGADAGDPAMTGLVRDGHLRDIVRTLDHLEGRRVAISRELAEDI